MAAPHSDAAGTTHESPRERQWTSFAFDLTTLFLDFPKLSEEVWEDLFAL